MFLEAAIISVTIEIPIPLCNLKVHDHIYKSSSLVPIQS
jgi:hypothetical protein